MKKSSIGITLNHFDNWMDLYADISEKIAGDDQVFTGKDEKVELIEALVLKICALWEQLVEELMIDCLNRDSSQYSEFVAEKLPKHIPRSLCMAMIQGMGYIDFRGVSDVKGTAKLILTDKYNPFKRISRSDGNRIDELYKFRNYIAHLSNHSHRSLKKMYLDKYRIRRFQEPGRFLIAIDSKTKRPRLDSYIFALDSAVVDMASHLGYRREFDS